MRRIAAFAIAALCGAVSSAQDVLDCIDPDVLRGLLLQGQGERPLAIAATVPQEISGLRMPGAFAWIGSSERFLGRVDATSSASQVTAAWRTSLAPDAAHAAAVAALTSSGWAVQELPGALPPVFSSTTRFPQTACRDGKPVSFMVSTMDGVTYVLTTIQRGTSNNTACSGPARLPTFTRNGVETHMPRLELPADPATGVAAGLGGGGMSFSGDSLSARAEFTLRDSADNVARHFARQMADQGWKSDATWSGASTAGSSWTKQPATGAIVQGTLSVTAVGEQRFLVLLRVNSLQ